MPSSRPAGDLFADGVNVLVPRDLLARHDQLAGAVHVAVVALADRPLHQLRAAVHEVRRLVGCCRDELADAAMPC